MYRGVSLLLALIVGMGGASFLYSLLAPEAQLEAQQAATISAPETAATGVEPAQGEADELAASETDAAANTDGANAELEAAASDADSSVTEVPVTEIAATEQNGAEPVSTEQASAQQEADASGAEPALDIVRVEPSGDTLIAGIAGPSSRVGLIYNGDVIAEVDAGVTGDFVIAPDVPLPPGDGTLRIAVIGDDGEPAAFAEEEVAVIVPQTGSADGFLVSILRPGEPVEIIDRQSPEGEIVQTPDQEDVAQASATQAGSAETSSEQAAALEDRLAEDGLAEDRLAVDSAIPATTETAEEDASPGEQAQELATTAPEDAAIDEQATVVTEGGTSADESAEETAAAATAGDADDSAGAPAVPASPQQLAAAELNAAGSNNSDQPLETALPSAEPAADEEAASTTVASGSGDQQASAPTEIAALDTSDEPQPAAPPFSVVIDAIELEGNRIWIAGAANPGAIIRLYQDNGLMGEAQAGPEGRFLYEGELTAPGDEVTVRADLLAAGSGDVVARAQVPFSMPRADAPEAELAAAAPSAQQETTESAALNNQGASPASDEAAVDEAPVARAVEAQTFVAEPSDPIETAAAPASSERVAVLDMGRVIIRRGDNLWTLSRRVFGQGIRFTAIYDANRDQIQDPAMIFPGQVFDVPEPNDEWGQVPGMDALDPEQVAPMPASADDK
ncbi:MAG: LysM peptidoglycan-binding domain-containing protein [Pseudomonadota bacterium]